jgi:SAM-dependent methyltransferase
MAPSAQSPELNSVKTRLKKIWMAGNYDRFARDFEGSAQDFYERLKFAPGCQLLDVGCGSGQLALIALRDGLEVTGIDIASNLAAALRAGGAITHGTHAMKGTRTEWSTALLPLLFCRSPCPSPRAELKRYLSADRHISKLTYF